MKSRRELFEEQLKDLQKDISSLSNKLVSPSVSGLNADTKAKSPQSELKSASLTNGSNRIKYNKAQLNEDQLHGLLEQLKEELRIAKKERDDAVFKLEQVNKEVEELRKSATESLRLKTTYNYLKQDYESLKVSLESSERIRKQQKELIGLLQKSHLVHGDSASTISFGSNSSTKPVVESRQTEKHNRQFSNGSINDSNKAADSYRNDFGIAEQVRQSQQQQQQQQSDHWQSNEPLNAFPQDGSEMDTRVRRAKKSSASSSKTKKKGRSPEEADNLDIFLAAAPPSDISSLVSAVPHYPHAAEPYPTPSSNNNSSNNNNRRSEPFVPYFQQQYPPTVDLSRDSSRGSGNMHINTSHHSSSKEVSFSRQLIAPSPHPKNQPVSEPHLLSVRRKSSSKPSQPSSAAAVPALTRRASLPIHSRYEAAASTYDSSFPPSSSFGGRPPKYPQSLPSYHSAGVLASRPSRSNPIPNPNPVSSSNNYWNDAPFFQQHEYTGRRPLSSSSSAVNSGLRPQSQSTAARSISRQSTGGRSLRTSGSTTTARGSVNGQLFAREGSRPRSAPPAGRRSYSSGGLQRVSNS